MAKVITKALRRVAVAMACIALSAFALAGCSGDKSISPENVSSELTYDHSMELKYAKLFSVDYYNDGYKLITLDGEGSYLVVPEGAAIPGDLSPEIVVLQQPLDQIYLVASSAFDMFKAIDGIDTIHLSGTKVSSWHIKEAVDAMNSGKILYAGKYNIPDYELILSEGCDLAIESTMIYHTPEVKEAIEGYGIPVFVDMSSYEDEPLGRSEWVKVYGAMLNKEAEAEAAFDAQEAMFDAVADEVAGTSTGKTIAFFYITTSGEVNVRKSTDYVPKMIALAGGEYAFSDLEGDPDSRTSSVTMQMEDFYNTAKDCDILIYNSTITGEVDSIDELLGLSSFMGEFTAVSTGNVWCTSQNMYQESMQLGYFVKDLHTILVNPDASDSELVYLRKLH